ncbi:MAG: hypothetical protein ABSF59_12645 [Candidatus Sulfotelmatobacter sp.]
MPINYSMDAGLVQAGQQRPGNFAGRTAIWAMKRKAAMCAHGLSAAGVSLATAPVVTWKDQ